MKWKTHGLTLAAAVLALAVAGCGSSSNTMDEEPPPPPTPVEMAEMELETAQASLMGLAADASHADRLTAQQAVLMAAQGVVAALQAANAGTNEVTAAQAKVTEYQAMVATTQMAIADAALDAAINEAMAAVMALGDDATHADRLAAEQEVVTAAKAKLEALVARDAPQSEVTAAQAVVTMYEDRVAATRMAMADAEAAASLMEKKDALMMAKDAAMAATSNAEMLAAQMAVVAAAKAVAAEAGASEADVEAANADVAMYEAMIAATGMMMPLDHLVGAKVKSELKRAHGTLEDVAGADLAAQATARAAAWLKLDPTDATFDSAGDSTGGTDDVAQFSLIVSNQKISVTATPATDTTPQGARNNAPTVTSSSATAYKASTERAAPSLGEGWTGITHERTYTTDDRNTLATGDDVTVRDILTTYTNQEASVGTYYAEFFSSIIGQDGTLSLAEGTHNRAMSSGFPAANQQVYEYDDGTDAVGRPHADRDNPLIGTYYGVPGRFTCTTDNDCTATRDASGNLMLGTANWRFTPDGDPSTITVPDTNTDDDYLTFGYWLEEVMDATGTTAYRAGVYYPVAGSMTGSIGETVKGEATYTGPAAGVFAKREYDPDSGGTVETAGRFTARASLTADFDMGDMDINGKITDFMHDGSMIDPMWAVTMKEGMIDANGDDNVADDGATFVSDPTKQAAGDGSQWTGRFYGHYHAAEVAVGATDNDVTPVNESTFKPTGVAGAFSKTFDNGEVLGAFGATR